MAVRKTAPTPGIDAHRQRMIELVREIDEKNGIHGDRTVTPEELWEMQIASGIRPEDNLGSREIMRMRYGDDWEDEGTG